MGAGHRKDHVMIRRLAFSASRLFSGEERGARNGANDGTCPGEEASIKIPKVQGSKSFWVRDVQGREGRHTPTPWGQEAPASGTLPELAQSASSSGCSSVSLITPFITS